MNATTTAHFYPVNHYNNTNGVHGFMFERANNFIDLLYGREAVPQSFLVAELEVFLPTCNRNQPVMESCDFPNSPIHHPHDYGNTCHNQ